MTEFLKNNPVALRHCLLYVYLQEEQVGKAFTNFCETVGDGVIKKEDFEFWFDQFKQGKFDDDKEPAVNIKEILQNDRFALRACIFYQSLEFHQFAKNHKSLHHSSFAKYQNFCKVIGDDVMEYREFDFWFYRFLNEEYDMNYERDENRKVYELTDMPMDIMEKVVEYLDIFDRINLTKTSRSLQNFTKNQKLFHDTLELTLSEDIAHLHFGNRNYKIWYKKEGDDCFRTFRKDGKMINGASPWKIALQDFEQIIKNPKLYLKVLNIHCMLDSRDLNDSSLVSRNELSELVNVFKTTHYLHVKKLTLEAYSLESLLKILPSFEPGYLTTIIIRMKELSVNALEKLMDVDQWKQAKHFKFDGHWFVGSLRYFYHFETFTVFYKTLSLQIVRQMKELLLKSPIFKSWELIIYNPIDKPTIRKEFDDAIEKGTDYYMYPIPNSTDVLEIEHGHFSFLITKKKG